jgi:hypothetical protein
MRRLIQWFGAAVAAHQVAKVTLALGFKRVVSGDAEVQQTF